MAGLCLTLAKRKNRRSVPLEIRVKASRRPGDARPAEARVSVRERETTTAHFHLGGCLEKTDESHTLSYSMCFTCPCHA